MGGGILGRFGRRLRRRRLRFQRWFNSRRWRFGRWRGIGLRRRRLRFERWLYHWRLRFGRWRGIRFRRSLSGDGRRRGGRARQVHRHRVRRHFPGASGLDRFSHFLLRQRQQLLGFRVFRLQLRGALQIRQGLVVAPQQDVVAATRPPRNRQCRVQRDRGSAVGQPFLMLSQRVV